MKQTITVKQLNELSEKGKEKLEEWMRRKKYYIHARINLLMSIGQMIEFLDSEQDYQFHIFRRTLDWKIIVNDLQYGKVLGEELADALWQACLEVLNV